MSDGLPSPTGYHILVRLPEIKERTAGGIIKPDQLLDKEHVASIIVQVVAMGDLCYTGKTPSGDPKFPTGPWCEVGDHIVMKSYAGTRLKVDGIDYRLITDDSVQAVVENAGSVERG